MSELSSGVQGYLRYIGQCENEPLDLEGKLDELSSRCAKAQVERDLAREALVCATASLEIAQKNLAKLQDAAASVSATLKVLMKLIISTKNDLNPDIIEIE